MMIRARRIAERRRHATLLPIGQLRHVVQTTAADDADAHAHAPTASTYRLPLASRIYPAATTGSCSKNTRYSWSIDLPQERALEFERLHRIQVEAHDPRKVEVRRRGQQVGGEHRGLPCRFEVDDLMKSRVPTGPH